MKRLVAYRGHEWRERLPLRSGVYVCAECGAVISGLSEMADARWTCKPRLAPIDWLPLSEQTDDRVRLVVGSADELANFKA